MKTKTKTYSAPLPYRCSGPRYLTRQQILTIVSSIDALARSVQDPKKTYLRLATVEPSTLPFEMMITGQGSWGNRTPIVGFSEYFEVWHCTPNNDDLSQVSGQLTVSMEGPGAKVCCVQQLHWEGAAQKFIDTLVDFLLGHGIVADRGSDEVLEAIYSRVDPKQPSHSKAIRAAVRRTPSLSGAPFVSRFTADLL